MIAVANARVMHGRDPFDPSTGHRHMQGCLMDMDWVLSTSNRAPPQPSCANEDQRGVTVRKLGADQARIEL